MNGWQLVRQIRYLLRQRKWEGEPTNEVVFRSNSVRITPIDMESFLGTANPGSPCCRINLGRRTSDQQAKGYVAQEVLISIGVQVEGDEVKENATVGANRTAGQGSSKGRGLAEVESEVMAVLDDVTAMQGFQVQGYSAGAVEEAQVSTSLAFVYCEYSFMFYCTSQLTWLGPTSLNGSGSTGGSISLTWEAAPLSWASISASGGQIIRYAAGSTPPEDPDDGIAGPAVTGTSESATISPLSSGTYAISIFTMYKESGAASAADRNSPATTIVLSVP